MNETNVEATANGHRATVLISNPLGLHLRPASQLVKLASEYAECEISLSKEGQIVNGKSIMGVIMLAAEQGSEIVVEANGAGSEEAVSAIVQLIDSGFGES